jgi:hypothetical protein
MKLGVIGIENFRAVERSNGLYELAWGKKTQNKEEY